MNHAIDAAKTVGNLELESARVSDMDILRSVKSFMKQKGGINWVLSNKQNMEDHILTLLHN